MHGFAMSSRIGTSFFIKVGLSIPILALTCLPTYVIAANVGPGPISPVVQSSGGTTTVVGNTSITTSSNAVSVTNGTVELGGPNIQIQTSGTAFGFNIDASSNLAYLTSLAGSAISIVTTGSTYSYGLWATNPNHRATSTMVRLSNASIRTFGNGSSGVILANFATGILSNLQIETSGGVDPGNNGAGAYGINTQLGAQGSFDNVSILTHGVGGSGVLNSNVSTFVGNNISMNVQAYGMNTQTGATSTLNNSTIITAGPSNGIGIRVSNINFSSTGLYSTFVGDNLNVETFGTGSSGVVTRADSHANISNLSVLTHGENAAGLYALEEGSLLNVSMASISTEGLNANGAIARIGAMLSVNNAKITTQGEGASGAYVEAASEDPFSTVAQFHNSTITTNGLAAHGLEMLNGGTINTIDTDTHAHGAAALGLIINSAAGYLNNVTINGGSLTSDQAAGIGIIGGEANINLNGTTVTGNTHWLIVGDTGGLVGISPVGAPLDNEEGEGITNGLGLVAHKAPTTSFAATQHTLFADPTIANITVNNSILNGAALTMEGDTSTVLLENSSFWNMTGSSNLTNLTNANSIIQFSFPFTGYKTLTVTDYVGQNGTIVFNTFLQEDNSPSDQLVIVNGGSATGSTGLIVRNTGGRGAVTTENGILVVDAVDGSTAVDAFYLEQPAEAGPYMYSLYRGSVDDTGLENWYLRSKKRDDPIPDYRPEVSLYSSIYSNLINYNRTLLGTFHQRVGAEEQVHNPRAQNKNTAYMNGGWLRVINRGGNVHDRGILAHGPNFNYQLYAVQAGVDVYHYEQDQGQRDFAGFYLTGGGGYSSVRHYTHTKAGNANFDSYGFGLYWTHIGSNDWYVDGVFQGSYFEPNAYSQYQRLQQINTQSYAVSLEAGYPFHLWNNWSVAPEGQLVYQNLPGTRSFDAASWVRFDSSNSFITRLGTRLVWDKFSTAEKEARGKTTLWLTPSFSYESQGVSRTQFSSEEGWVPFSSSLRGTWFSVDVGATVQINPVVSLYGTVVGETYLNGRGQAYDVMAGLRFNL